MGCKIQYDESDDYLQGFGTNLVFERFFLNVDVILVEVYVSLPITSTLHCLHLSMSFVKT